MTQLTGNTNKGQRYWPTSEEQKEMKAEFAKKYGLKEDKPRAFFGLKYLAKKYKPKNPLDLRGFPCADHVSYWKKDGKSWCIVSQPYQIHSDEIEELTEICNAHGLKFCITSYPSWYCPNGVVFLQIYYKDRYEKLDHKMFVKAHWREIKKKIRALHYAGIKSVDEDGTYHAYVSRETMNNLFKYSPTPLPTNIETLSSADSVNYGGQGHKLFFTYKIVDENHPLLNTVQGESK